MCRSITLRLIICSFFLSAYHQVRAQALYFEDGIYFTKQIKGDSSRHRYTRDNLIYKYGRIFLYSYNLQDTYGQNKKIFTVNGDERNLDTVEASNNYSLKRECIKYVRITVDDNLKLFVKSDSTYSQTVIKYDYINYLDEVVDSESTGVEENKINIWIHPPRKNGFKLLEILPFPFVYLNDSVKNWHWAMGVGDFWADLKYGNWKGVLQLEFIYERITSQNIQTDIGSLECQVIVGKGVSVLGASVLKSFYNAENGFVRLEYKTINNDCLVFELIKINK